MMIVSCIKTPTRVLSRPKQYKVEGVFYLTENKRERTFSIYDKNWTFLSTVNEGELNAELAALEKELNEKKEGYFIG